MFIFFFVAIGLIVIFGVTWSGRHHLQNRRKGGTKAATNKSHRDKAKNHRGRGHGH